jgi:hypothetical protein
MSTTLNIINPFSFTYDNFKKFAREVYNDYSFGPWMTLVTESGYEVEVDNPMALEISMEDPISHVKVGCIWEGSDACFPATAVYDMNDLLSVMDEMKLWEGVMEMEDAWEEYKAIVAGAIQDDFIQDLMEEAYKAGYASGKAG